MPMQTRRAAARYNDQAPPPAPTAPPMKQETSLLTSTPSPVQTVYNEIERVCARLVDEIRDDHVRATGIYLNAARNCFSRLDYTERPAESTVDGADNTSGNTSSSNTRSNLALGPNLNPEPFRQKVSPFANVKPIQRPTPHKTEPIGTQRIQQEVIKGHRSTISIHPDAMIMISAGAINRPRYSDYTSVRHNLVAENNKSLNFWPHFDQDEDPPGWYEEVSQRFKVLPDERKTLVEFAEKARKYEPYVEEFLDEIGVDFSHVLCVFVQGKTKKWNMAEAGLDDHSARVLLKERDATCDQQIKNAERRWKKIMLFIEPPSEAQLAKAGLAAIAFKKAISFSLFQVARRSEFAVQLFKKVDGDEDDDNGNATQGEEKPFRDVACRICHLHSCTAHGEYVENEDSDDMGYDSESGRPSRRTAATGRSRSRSVASERAYNTSKESPGIASESEDDTPDWYDPKSINIRKRIIAVERDEAARAESTSEVSSRQINGHGNNQGGGDNGASSSNSKRPNVINWFKTNAWKIDARRPFYPCSHPGKTCETAECSCYRRQMPCEKTCGCAVSCARRFRGCTCAASGRACNNETRCECQKTRRECDPDLCGTCGVVEVLDPVNRYNAKVVRSNCQNCAIQRGVQKRTILGKSEVQGFGLFMGEPAKPEEFLGEYKGELISQPEGDRRGATYQYLSTNYTFKLNTRQEIDATHFGNKFRFVNHSSRPDIQNSFARLKLCSGLVRIGLFASCEIRPGEELFFDYGYPKDISRNFWERGELGPSKGGGSGKDAAASKAAAQPVHVVANAPATKSG
ncbi:hypothetical protein BDY21DRAFT_109824, partial [Lineolata rhizophorae]